MTFSIAARDPETGALGVATATGGPAVGALVPHVVAGVGAVITQAMTNPYLAFDSLRLLPSAGARQAMAAALEADQDRDRRQLIVVDRSGEVAMWTGARCEEHAGHASSGSAAAAGNILAGPDVLDAMLSAFTGGPSFGRALLDALAAGHRAGGDRRGTHSAALKVYSTEAFADIDLRVDWSERPIEDLKALFERTTNGDYATFFSAVPRRGSAG